MPVSGLHTRRQRAEKGSRQEGSTGVPGASVRSQSTIYYLW